MGYFGDVTYFQYYILIVQKQNCGPQRKTISIDCWDLRCGVIDTYWKSTGRTTSQTMKSDDKVQREWTVIGTVRQRKPQLFGHICTMPDNWLLVIGVRDAGRWTSLARFACNLQSDSAVSWLNIRHSLKVVSKFVNLLGKDDETKALYAFSD